MKIDRFEFNMFGENTYVVTDTETNECAVVDPGMVSPEECGRMDGFLTRNGLKLKCVICTHLHVDHLFGVKYLMEKYDVELYANENDEFLAERVNQQLQMFGIPVTMDGVSIGKNITDGDTIKIGNGQLCVITVPGHSPGSVALYDEADKFVITGDALFRLGIGRTDLPGGDYPTLIQSIKSGLMSLPDDTTVYPGHGQASTIAYEKRWNPYL